MGMPVWKSTRRCPSGNTGCLGSPVVLDAVSLQSAREAERPGPTPSRRKYGIFTSTSGKHKWQYWFKCCLCITVNMCVCVCRRRSLLNTCRGLFLEQDPVVIATYQWEIMILSMLCCKKTDVLLFVILLSSLPNNGEYWNSYTTAVVFQTTCILNFQND